MASETEARQWAEDGFKSALGRDPTLFEVQMLQAVARLETGYGQGWKAAGQGSWNMGAVQAGMPPCGPNAFLYEDSHPNPDGTSTKYSVCFKKYSGPVEGMADVARILYKQMHIDATTVWDFSTQMYERHYYEGFGSTKEARIANHVKALTSNLKAITTKLGEDMPPAGGPEAPAPKAPSQPPQSPPSALSYFLVLSFASREGDLGEIHMGQRDNSNVRLVQMRLKEKGLYSGQLDGDYGPLTDAAIRKFLS